MSEVRFNLGPYSHIVIDIPDTYKDEQGTARLAPLAVVEDATAVAGALQEWFDGLEQNVRDDAEAAAQEPYRGEDGDPGPQDDHARPEFRLPQQPPQQREHAPQQEQPRYGAGSGVETREQMLKRSWGDCPECGQTSKPSIEKYQQWEETDDGVEVPAKHYCGSAGCPRKGKTLWRRELVQAF